MRLDRKLGVPKISVWVNDEVKDRIDVSNDAMSFSWNKSLTSPVGQWTLTLVPRQGKASQTHADLDRLAYLYRSLSANKVVSFGYDRHGGIGLGLISSVSRTRTLFGPRIGHGLKIVGMDAGKLLVQDSVIQATLTTDHQAKFEAKVKQSLGANHPILRTLPGLWGPEQDQRNGEGIALFTGVGVQEVVDWFLKNAPSVKIPLLRDAIGGTGHLSEFINTDLVTTWNDDRIFNDQLHTYEGGLWDFLYSVLDKDFYEIRIDSKPTEGALPDLYLVIRPKPYDEPMLEVLPVRESTGNGWQDLRTFIGRGGWHDINEELVFQEQLGHSDADAYSYYSLTADNELVGNSQAEAMGLRYPVIDMAAAKRFGLRAYKARLTLLAGNFEKLAAGDKSYDGEISLEVREYRNRLLNWYRLNPYFENGSISIFGGDHYRCGDRVRLSWVTPAYGNEKGMMYYCNSVAHQWQFGQHFTTSLGLSRGHNRGMVEAIQQDIADQAPLNNFHDLAES